VSSCYISLGDLAELEHYKNLKEVHLRWIYDFPVEEALRLLKRCTNLRRITLTLTRMKELHFPSFIELRDFIMQMKHLTYLHIIYDDIPNCGHFKSEVDEVTAFILPRRPNFKFYVSCCSKFDEFRVPRREFSYC
jgi:hypothetical protein